MVKDEISERLEILIKKRGFGEAGIFENLELGDVLRLSKECFDVLILEESRIAHISGILCTQCSQPIQNWYELRKKSPLSRQSYHPDCFYRAIKRLSRIDPYFQKYYDRINQVPSDIEGVRNLASRNRTMQTEKWNL